MGREAMLYDLMHMKLGDWHPVSDVPHTSELDVQIDKSIPKNRRLIIDFINSGIMPGESLNNGTYKLTARELMDQLNAMSPDHKIPMQQLAPVLRALGCTDKIVGTKRCWVFEELGKMKKKWCNEFGDFNYEEGDTWTLSNTSY